MAKRGQTHAKELLIALVGDAEMLVNDAYEHRCMRKARVPQYAYVHLLIDGFLFTAPTMIDNAGGFKGLVARGAKRTLSCVPLALQTAAIKTLGFSADKLIPHFESCAGWIVRTVVRALIPNSDPNSATHEKFTKQISSVLMSLLSSTDANGRDPGRKGIYDKYAAHKIAQALADRAAKKPAHELCEGCSLRELCAHLIGDARVDDDVVLDILRDYANWMRRALYERLEGEIAKFVRESFGPEKPAVVSARMRLGSRHIGVPAGRTRSAVESSLIQLVDRADSILEMVLGEKVSEILEDIIARSLFNFRQNLADAERRIREDSKASAKRFDFAAFVQWLRVYIAQIATSIAAARAKDPSTVRAASEIIVSASNQMLRLSGRLRGVLHIVIATAVPGSTSNLESYVAALTQCAGSMVASDAISLIVSRGFEKADKLLAGREPVRDASRTAVALGELFTLFISCADRRDHPDIPCDIASAVFCIAVEDCPPTVGK